MKLNKQTSRMDVSVVRFLNDNSILLVHLAT